MTNLHTALRLRLAASQAATKKFDAVCEREHEGRMHGTLQVCGASRTGRWSGRGLQLQNLKRPGYGIDNDHVAESVLDGSFPFFYGGRSALETLGGSIRAAVAAPEGKLLVVSDLANIESRVVGWLAGDPKLQRIFAEGRDPYKAFAEDWLRIPYDEVDKGTRNLCKPPALGCGYGLGANGLVAYAESMGVTMDQHQAQGAVTAFRRTYSRVPALWRKLEHGFIETLLSGKPYRNTFAREGRFLTLRLPSGRKLYYDTPQHDPDEGLSYLGQNQYTGQWQRIRTYGAKLLENLTQAVARDLLAHAMLLYTRHGGTVVGHVHDEVIAEEDAGKAQEALRLLDWCLRQVPPWGRGLVLDSEGYVAKRYRKG